MSKRKTMSAPEHATPMAAPMMPKEPLNKVAEPEDIADDHQVRGHLQTLMDAEMIKQNPDKMKRVAALAGRHHSALKGIRRIKDLKNVFNEKFGAGGLKKPTEDLE